MRRVAMEKARSTFSRAWREERIGLVALVILLVLALAAIFAPLYTQSPDVIDPLHQLQPSSMQHWFGTDGYGRDIFSRTMYAGRVSLGLGLVVTVVVSLIGGLLGLLAGYLRALDGLIMRIMDGMMAFPPIVLAIALVAVLGPGLSSEFIALSVVFTPRMARVVRGTTLQLKGAEYIDAARVSGVKGRSIVLEHIVPNGIAPLIIQASFTYAEVVLADAVLSFLGLGVAPPTPSWGNMIAEASTYLTSDPWFAVFPGLAIVVSVVSLNVAGDSIRSLVGHPSSSRPTTRMRRKGIKRKESKVVLSN